MREIEFRGKYKQESMNHKWVYGDLRIKRIKPCGVVIWKNDTGYPVIPKTVGEFTGMLDGKGNKIFEGDIVKADLDPNPDGVIGIIREVAFHDGMFVLSRQYGATKDFCRINRYYNIEVIGNITDNPELLE